MENIKKENIVAALSQYCERYDSQNRAANTLKDVSAATITHMLNGKWEKISDEMWRNVAAQIDYKEEKWEAVETAMFCRMTKVLEDAQENAMVMAVVGNAGSGKTFTCKHYLKFHKRVFLLCCNEYWNRKDFLQELMMVIGKDYTGLSVSEMMRECVRSIKTMDSPLLILDEADKLSDSVLYFFITLYNQLEDECGIVMCATNHLEKKIKRGIKLNKKGYQEIWSRLGRKCFPLNGVDEKDITKICEANGITDNRSINEIIDDSDSDLRRVKRKIHAKIKQRG